MGETLRPNDPLHRNSALTHGLYQRSPTFAVELQRVAICRGELRGHGHHMGGGEVREVGEESSHVCLELGE